MTTHVHYDGNGRTCSLNGRNGEDLEKFLVLVREHKIAHHMSCTHLEAVVQESDGRKASGFPGWVGTYVKQPCLSFPFGLRFFHLLHGE